MPRHLAHDTPAPGAIDPLTGAPRGAKVPAPQGCLIWAQAADEGDAFATSELLAKLEVTDYEKGPAFSLMPDHGVEVYGIAAMGGTVGALFIGLGEGPDADRARQTMKAAVKAAHGEGPPVGEA